MVACSLATSATLPVTRMPNAIRKIRPAAVSISIGDSAEDVLCVFSFAVNATTATISAPEFAGRPLYDLFGGSSFPSFDDEGNVTLTLGTQSFYWLHIGAAPTA